MRPRPLPRFSPALSRLESRDLKTAATVSFTPVNGSLGIVDIEASSAGSAVSIDYNVIGGKLVDTITADGVSTSYPAGGVLDIEYDGQYAGAGTTSTVVNNTMATLYAFDGAGTLDVTSGAGINIVYGSYTGGTTTVDATQGSTVFVGHGGHDSYLSDGGYVVTVGIPNQG